MIEVAALLYSWSNPATLGDFLFCMYLAMGFGTTPSLAALQVDL